MGRRDIGPLSEDLGFAEGDGGLLHLHAHGVAQHAGPEVGVELVAHSVLAVLDGVALALVHVEGAQGGLAGLLGRDGRLPFLGAGQFAVDALALGQRRLGESGVDAEEVVQLGGEGNLAQERPEGGLEEGQLGGRGLGLVASGVIGVNLDGDAAVVVVGPVKLGEVLGNVPAMREVTWVSRGLLQAREGEIF